MQAGFWQGEQGALFYLLHEPDDLAVRGAVLYVPPFAEELNKSRHMAARQARLLAERGYVVLMPDLYGCGDSGGDFGDARWQDWLADLATCYRWLQTQYAVPVILWGLRAGCLLISDLLQTRQLTPAALLYWQPVIQGERYLAQFLRLRMAASMLGDNKETTGQLQARLQGGETLEVAGYALTPALASGLAAARLSVPPVAPVIWLEVVQSDPPALPPVSTQLITAWREQDADVRASAVAGDPFWTTQEIHQAPALLTASLESLEALA
ncbi:hydrolase 2, exosortase A system-associated [Thiohalophilus sp.]|uniref:hydrolase 2, exosortase A system-associated n=1 Tax=Thiohalophilus sp. TaxID=3028392 RepID=UPI002ACDBB47|nr:hydrolase 2, exosortase A system-associated [Thiohalophilus sp.]MDZ7803478.1 hydrolase 2, exosortase A system-associated [Thiohalophilus sp.]